MCKFSLLYTLRGILFFYRDLSMLLHHSFLCLFSECNKQFKNNKYLLTYNFNYKFKLQKSMLHF